MKSKRVWLVLFIGVLFITFAAGIITITAANAWNMLFQNTQNVSDSNDIFREPVTYEALENFQTLSSTHIPEKDLHQLAARLKGQENIPLMIEDLPIEYQVGDESLFWVTKAETNESVEINAILRYRTEHSYFWIQEGINFNEDDLERLALTFENQIYPTNRSLFGSEWLPGIDRDPRLYILYAADLGDGLAGYFSTADEFHPLVQLYSNAHEMIFLNADIVNFDDEFAYGVLAHEFQQMIHWFHDRNESAWLTEGFSQLAAVTNGYASRGFEISFSMNPDTSLTDWKRNANTYMPQYGSAFLFSAYLLDRFGEETIRAVVAAPENGLEGLDAVFEQQGWIDAFTEKQVTADEVFRDWSLANYLQNGTILDGRYGYTSTASLPSFSATEAIDGCSIGWQQRSVAQYGTDYIRLTCMSPFHLTFEGSTETNLLSIDPHSGQYAFWSNRGDQSDMLLTHAFDLTNVFGPVSLKYWAWYDLEENYDYVYLEASENGSTWEILITPSCTVENPTGTSFGCGYTGNSGGWRMEEVDLSRFAGKQVWLRFEYITDAVTTGEGFLLDDVEITSIGYFNDFEQDSGGWQSDGFVRIINRIPQNFLVSLIYNGAVTDVQELSLNPDQRITTFVNVSPLVEDVVLVVSGGSRYSRLPALYRFRVDH